MLVSQNNKALLSNSHKRQCIDFESRKIYSVILHYNLSCSEMLDEVVKPGVEINTICSRERPSLMAVFKQQGPGCKATNKPGSKGFSSQTTAGAATAGPDYHPIQCCEVVSSTAYS
jgi:hypothetical protein